MKTSPQLTTEQAISRAKKAAKQGKIAVAEELYSAVLQYQPNHPIAKKGLRKIQNGLSRNQSMQVETSNPSQDQTNTLINLYHSGQMIETERACRELLTLYPQALVILNILGAALQGQGKLQEAVTSYNNALQIRPDYVEAHNNRGNALQKLGQLDDALASYNKAIQFRPDDYADAYSNRGIVLKKLGRLQEALASYNKAIQIRSDYAEAYSNRGVVLQDMGQLEEALASCDKAIQIRPDYAEAHWNLSLVSLLLGDFKNGWREYEYGKLIKKNSRRVPHGVMYKVWGGESIVNKTIFVATEQGIGDEVFFASVIPDLIDKHPRKIILECDCRLELLFARSFPDASVRGKRTETNKAWLKEFGNIDFQIAIGSLPKFFRQDLSDFPLRKSFLLPHNGLKKKWRNRYNDLGDGMKVGISWRGGSSKILRTNRSIGLEILRPILLSNAFFINLQYGNCVDEIAEFKESSGVNVHDWDDADPLTDLENFAAEISELDLVISVDNSTVHFAGALGIPVWMLTPFSPDWRWMTRRKDSPWYKTIRLFRQKKFGDWYDVIDEIYSELQMIIK